MKIFKSLILTIALCTFMAHADESNFQFSVDHFSALTSERIDKVKEGSRPFILSQNKLAPTVVMLHGLSDSPGSMKEVANIYFKLGYNVVTVLLRDHGLLAPYRHDIREEVTLSDWRKDIDQLMSVAFSMSDSDKVALIGYSLGGGLALDTADRYEGKISSLVMLAPLLKMNHGWAAPMAKVLKHVMYSTKKGIPETSHFYPDIALNQTYHAHKLTVHLKKDIINQPSKKMRALPKMMFLTDADTTIVNKYAITAAAKLKMPAENVVVYNNEKGPLTVLHRDLPMSVINASKEANPHLDEMLSSLESFLIQLSEK
jgi:alpha-beta hydrolase superfamily lysophospholipase